MPSQRPARPSLGGAHHDYDIIVYDQPFERPYAPGTIGPKTTHLHFQEGPVNEAGPNGISDESLLAILIHRAQGFAAGNFKSREGSLALTKMQEAMHWLRARYEDRANRGVEGYNKT